MHVEWTTRMPRSALINPFSLVTDRPRPVLDQSKRRDARSTPVCANCRSDDIVCHATAQWSNEAQEWQLTDTFDQPAHCGNCNDSCSIIWLTPN
jgi:hypothetical protein